MQNAAEQQKQIVESYNEAKIQIEEDYRKRMQQIQKEFRFDWFETPSDGIYWVPVKVCGDSVDAADVFQEFDINDSADQVQETPTYIRVHGIIGFKFATQLSINPDSVAKLTAHIKPDNTPTQTIGNSN